MRFQALMPDVLHWLGIRKIDNMVSMSDMYVSILQLVFCLPVLRKYNAIVESGIPILKRYDIPGNISQSVSNAKDTDISVKNT